MKLNDGEKNNNNRTGNIIIVFPNKKKEAHHHHHPISASLFRLRRLDTKIRSFFVHCAIYISFHEIIIVKRRVIIWKFNCCFIFNNFSKIFKLCIDSFKNHFFFNLISSSFYLFYFHIFLVTKFMK